MAKNRCKKNKKYGPTSMDITTPDALEDVPQGCLAYTYTNLFEVMNFLFYA